MSVERLTKERMERDRTNSVNPCMARSISCRCELSQLLVSRTVNYDSPDRRTVADIQRKLVKWNKLNVVFRYFLARKEKKTVAGWRLGLENILQIFDVRSVARVITVVNFPLHKAIPMNTDTAAAAVHNDVTNTKTITSGIQNDVVNTPVAVSDSHRNASKRPEDLRGQNRPVSVIYSIYRRVTTDPCLASRKVSDLGWK